MSVLQKDPIAPGRGFLPGLRWRLATTRVMPEPRAAWPAGVAAAMLVAAVVWEGVARTSEQIESPAPLPGRPVAGMPTTVDHPFATFADLDVVVFEEDLPAADTPPDPMDYPAPYRLVTYQADAPQ